jgi:antitoxin component YwqK of YwqJK toxin-antitoxin module
MSLVSLPRDILIEIAILLDDKCDYYPFAISCKRIAEVCSTIKERKEIQLSRWLTEYDDNGNKVKEYEVNSKGILNGKCIQYKMNANGIWNIHLISSHKKRVLHGKYIEYNSNGSINIECTYRDGKYNDTYIQYSNGVIRKSIDYKDGIKHGLVKHFIKGKLIVWTRFHNGKQVSY